MEFYKLIPFLYLGLCFVPAATAESSTYYHLAKNGSTCEVAALQNQSADVVCLFYDVPDDSGSNSCASVRMTWRKLGVRNQENLTTSRKYGIWEAVPGRDMAANEYVSLLRVRDVGIGDIGTYHCEIVCDKKAGGLRILHHFADVCMQHISSNNAICSTRSSQCTDSFWNGACDPECETEDNLYDGFDCTPQMKRCPADLSQFCKKAYANRQCDQKCNTAECGWDGGDCLTDMRRNNYATDTVVLFVAPQSDAETSTIDLSLLGFTFSQLLSTIVQMIPDDWLASMPKTVSQQSGVTSEDNRGTTQPLSYLGSKLYLKLDNTNCQRNCLNHAKYAARFIETAMDNGWDPGISISKVAVLGRVESRCTLENNTLLGMYTPSPEERATVVPAHHMPSLQTDDHQAPWLVIGIALGAAFLLVTLAIGVLIRYRFHKWKHQKEMPCPEAEVLRIKAAKDAPVGTEV